MLVLGYGLSANGQLHPQTKSRCLEAARFYLERKINRDVVILYITVAYRNMGDLMKEYLISLGIPRDQIYFEPVGVGTRGEIETFLQKVSPDDVVGAISSWYHLPRIALIFRKLRATPAWLEAAHGHVSWKQDVLKELGKYLNDLFDRRPLVWWENLRAK